VTGSIQDFYVDFDGTQILCRTDVDQIADWIVESYSPMLVGRATRQVGKVEVYQTPSGYSLRGSSAQEIAFGPRYAFNWLKMEVLYGFSLSRPDLLWLHAGVVRDGGVTVLIVGPSGSGKSTLTTHLCQRGWRFLSDEVAPLSMATDDVLPYPQAPSRRLNPGRAMEPEEVEALDREFWKPPADVIWHGSSKVGFAVFPRFAHGLPAKLLQMDAGEASLELIRNAANFYDHKAAAVARLTNLAKSIPCSVLEYCDGTEAAAVIEVAAQERFQLASG
jgi:hypothetical protein